MRKNVVLMTTIGLVILIAVLTAALNAVFTVTKVEVIWSVRSEEGERESVALQAELESSYLGKSTTFLKLDDVTATVAGYPSFEIVSLKKGYPQRLLLEISERKELFAFLQENGSYGILDTQGSYLYDRETSENRAGGSNILLEGFSFSVKDGEVTGEYLAELVAIANVFAQDYDNIRANIVSVTLLSHYMGYDYFRVRMQEGVYFDVYTPKNNTALKAAAALEKYASLSYEERLYGYFDLIDLENTEEFTVSEHRPVPDQD